MTSDDEVLDADWYEDPEVELDDLGVESAEEYMEDFDDGS